ncbi:hypothetical protein LOAG_08299 [Loa loa]|uniref:Uncharacterized protein n=1 Tax=Loa loa TaxID=7209 RepID=A0A1S0TU91_LOALO|nr:hypothetical protein LOAG_08299 [Loa loa]EFO20191.1 hypothetical protein LOAG_08299 [Loa loa]
MRFRAMLVVKFPMQHSSQTDSSSRMGLLISRQSSSKKHSSNSKPGQVEVGPVPRALYLILKIYCARSKDAHTFVGAFAAQVARAFGKFSFAKLNDNDNVESVFDI